MAEQLVLFAKAIQLDPVSISLIIFVAAVCSLCLKEALGLTVISLICFPILAICAFATLQALLMLGYLQPIEVGWDAYGEFFVRTRTLSEGFGHAVLGVTVGTMIGAGIVCGVVCALGLYD